MRTERLSTMINPLVLFLMGLMIGILTGFFGIGGGLLMTPALNILGLPMVHAIGTGFPAIAGNTLIGVIRHRKRGNVDLKLGIAMGVFCIMGVELGKSLVLHLEKLSLAGMYVRAAYIILLTVISIIMFRDYYSWKTRHNEAPGETIGSKANTHTMPRHIHRIELPPMISLSRSGVGSISLWVIIISGFLIGLLSGFMGIGGGLIGLPLMIYVMGVPTIIAVGTSLVIVFLTSCYGTASYALAGNVEWTAALMVLAGSAIGVHFGVYATDGVTEMKIKILFALLLFLVAVSVFLKQMDIVTVSSYLVVGSACVLSLAIVLPLRKKLRAR